MCLTGSKCSPASGVRLSVALSSSIFPAAKSGALFTLVLLQNCVHTCTYRMCNFIIHTRLQLHVAWAARVVAPLSPFMHDRLGILFNVVFKELPHAQLRRNFQGFAACSEQSPTVCSTRMSLCYAAVFLRYQPLLADF